MRRLVALITIAGAAWWFLRRRRATRTSATIGYSDGSSVTLEEGAPELERLLVIARDALAP